MKPRIRWAIALLMGATIFRAQTILFLPQVQMFGGIAPDGWFGPWLRIRGADLMREFQFSSDALAAMKDIETPSLVHQPTGESHGPYDKRHQSHG